MTLISAKHSQEEIVGFVLIVVLVTIIAMVFLAINLSKNPQTLSVNEITSFVQSAMMFTTDCYQSAENRYDIKDLIKACSGGETCLDGTSTCDILNETLKGILQGSWRPGINNTIKSCSLRIARENITLIGIKEGVCLGNKIGTSVPISGGMQAEFEKCS
jgi:hypothetical protein